jgi:hypothetical protein
MSKRIEGEWSSYRHASVPENAGVTQIEETQKAFYAGAQACLKLLSSLNDPLSIQEELAAWLVDFKRKHGLL